TQSGIFTAANALRYEPSASAIIKRTRLVIRHTGSYLYKSRLIVIGLYLVEKILDLFVSIRKNEGTSHGKITPRKNLVWFFLLLYDAIERVLQFEGVIWRQTFYRHTFGELDAYFICFLPWVIKINGVVPGGRGEASLFVNLEQMLR